MGGGVIGVGMLSSLAVDSDPARGFVCVVRETGRRVVLLTRDGALFCPRSFRERPVIFPEPLPRPLWSGKDPLARLGEYICGCHWLRQSTLETMMAKLSSKYSDTCMVRTIITWREKQQMQRSSLTRSACAPGLLHHSLIRVFLIMDALDTQIESTKLHGTRSPRR
jgi:hypothetical protein